MSLHRKYDSLTAQPKTNGSAQARKMPASPPVYRPQPAPKVLQTKTHAAPQPSHRLQPTFATPVVYRPRPASQIAGTNPMNAMPVSVQPKMIHRPLVPSSSRREFTPVHLRANSPAVQRQAISKRDSGNNTTAAHRIIQRTPTGAYRPAVVQATKFYPNLHPGATVAVDRSNIFSLDNFANQYRLHRVGTHSVNVPNMKYNFVRTREGQTLLHNRYRHPSLAEGQQVLYAGEVFFNNGQLQWWSNGSGHYQPDADGAEQANLPMDYFYTYQQVIKGEHTRRKG